MSLPQESPLWMRLLVLSESMDDPGALPSTSSLSCADWRRLCPRHRPAEQFPEFATIRLCRSMASLLGRLQQPPSP